VADDRSASYKLAHDLLSPLTEIKALVHVLRADPRVRMEEAATEACAQIDRHCEHMRAMILGILDDRRAEKEEVDLDVVLKHVRFLLKTPLTRADATIETDTMPIVFGVRSTLTRLFQNLVENALKYRSEAAPCIRIRARKETGAWRFSVEDNGIGIAPEDRQRVFEESVRLPTANAAVPGQGIGLAICRQVVDEHGGTIWIEGNEAGGSNVVFTLPRAA